MEEDISGSSTDGSRSAIENCDSLDRSTIDYYFKGEFNKDKLEDLHLFNKVTAGNEKFTSSVFNSKDYKKKVYSRNVYRL